MDFIMRKLPFMQALVEDMSEEEKDHLVELMMRLGREMTSEPGELTGTALVAVGRK